MVNIMMLTYCFNLCGGVWASFSPKFRGLSTGLSGDPFFQFFFLGLCMNNGMLILFCLFLVKELPLNISSFPYDL